MTGGWTHLIDCWGRSVPEKWRECGRRNKVAACLALSWRRSQQNGTESNRPERRRGEKTIYTPMLALLSVVDSFSVTLPVVELYLFVKAAQVSVLPHAVQDLRCCFHHFRTMPGNSAEDKDRK